MIHIFDVTPSTDVPTLQDWLSENAQPYQFTFKRKWLGQHQFIYVVQFINNPDLAIQFKLTFSERIRSAIVW